MEVKKIKKQVILILSTLLFAVILAGTASAANGTWVNETVDNSSIDTGQYTSIALDSSNNPHISYIDSTNGPTTANLKYAYNDSTGWHIETVVNGGVSLDKTSIALDSLGRPHISYTIYNYGHRSINYTYYDGSTWQTETAIPGGGGGCEESSLVLDSSGYPHISSSYSWSDGTNFNLTLKYAYKDNSGWHVEDADALYFGSENSAPNSRLYDSLALDSSKNPHISYYDPVNYDLKYAYKDNSGWHNQIVDTAQYVGFFTSIALDSSNNPHISYYDSPNGDLKYASWTGNAWTIETVDSSGNVGEYTSLALDSLNNPHISYYDSTNGVLKYAVKSGGTWTIETVDSESGATTGQFTSLALDSSGSPHISYSINVPIDDPYLKYAYFIPSQNPVNPVNPSNPTNQSGSTTVNAASSTNKTIGMQETGIPIAGLILAILMLFSGFITSKK